MSLVEMRGASRLWDGVVGLHPFDLRVERGELVVYVAARAVVSRHCSRSWRGSASPTAATCGSAVRNHG